MCIVRVGRKRDVMKPIYSKEMTELNRSYKETENIYASYAASHDVSTTTLCVLYSLYTAQMPCTQTQLVADWGIPMQTVNSCLKALEKSGIFLLEFAQGSRKRKYIRFTGQGEQMADRVVAPLVQGENSAFGALAPEEQQLLLQITRKHNALLQEYLLNQE